MNPTAQQLFHQAKQLHQQNRLAEAETHYLQVLQRRPHFAEAQHLLGVLLSERGKHQEGAQWLLRAIERQPTQPNYYHNLGKIYAAARQWDAAISAYRAAIKLAPQFAEAWFNLGNTYRNQGNGQQAERAFQRALKIRPQYAMAHYNLGNLYQEGGRMQSALTAYESCLAVKPNHALAHNNIAAVLEHWDRYAEAIKHYQRALEIEPQSKEALSNLAASYEKQGQTDLARATWQRYLRQHTDPQTQSWVKWHLAQLSEIIWLDTTSITAYRQQLLQTIEDFYQKPPQLILADLHRLSIQPPFDLAYQGVDDKDLKQRYGQFFEQFFKQLRPQIHGGKMRSLRVEKRRVGFVVTSGHEGVFIKCKRGMLNHLNTDLLDVTVVCNAPTGEAILRPAIENPQIKFLSIAPRLDIAIRQLQRAEFDILYFWEIGTDALNYFLPFCQLAPVQCTSWGWPVTSGIPTVQYFVSAEPLETPNATEHYTEELILFKKLPTYYYRPPVPKTLHSIEYFGLPVGKNVYLCAQNLRKVHPVMDELFLQILRRDPQGILVLINDKRAPITEKLKQRLQKKCADVYPQIYFVERMPEGDYLNLAAIANVILDTLHYTGGANTAYDAFAVGTPYVTLPTSYHRGSYGTAAYTQLGVTDLIAKNEMDYVHKALHVATDQQYRATLRQRMLANSHLIFNDETAVRELESFFINVKK